MFTQFFPCGPYSTNAYVVACAHTHEAAILDPAPGSFLEVKNFLNSHQLKAQKILLTHSHWDHIADVKQIKEHYQIPVYVHALDAPNLQNPGSDGLPYWIVIPAVQPDFLLEEGIQVAIGTILLQVLHTPGHSPGCVCFYEPIHHVLFSGDTLFKGAIGNLSFPTSQPSLMKSSLAKLARLPLQTRVFPGHGPMTTIEAESSLLTQVKRIHSSN